MLDFSNLLGLITPLTQNSGSEIFSGASGFLSGSLQLGKPDWKPDWETLGSTQALHYNSDFRGSATKKTPQPLTSSTKSFLGQSFTFQSGDGTKSKFSQLFNKTNAGSTAAIGNMVSGVAGAALGIDSRELQYGGLWAAGKSLNQGILDKVSPLGGMANRLSDVASGGIAKLFGKSTNYADGADKTFDTATDLLNYLGPYGMAANFALDTINALGGTHVEGVKKDDRVMSSSSYGGTAAKGSALGDADFGLVGGLSGASDKYKKKVKEAQRLMNLSGDILREADDRMAAASWQGNGLRNWMELNGGMERMHLAKSGMKLPTKMEISRVREILSRKSGGKIEKSFFEIEAEDVELEIPEFKDGGQLNVIPEGALHARKNNMDGAGKDFTHKGIPVIDKEGELQAEIERDEIIFRKEVTTKLEELMKDGSDKAAIEAGQLLVEEIFNNTDDRTGLIASITGEEPLSEEEELLSKMQNGGKTYPHWSKPKDWTEDKIPYEEWIKDLNPNEYNGNYDLEAAYKYFKKEDLERWKWAATRPTEEEHNYYMNYRDKDGRYIYHLGSIAEIPGTEDFIFLKKGKEENNPELHFETDGYWNGENGLKETHDLVFEGDRYYYRKKKTPKKSEGGSIVKEDLLEELTKLSPEKLDELKNIIKYLNQ